MIPSTSNPKVTEIRRSVQSSYARLGTLIEGQVRTLDPAKLYQPAIESEWTIMQSLAHFAEFMPYWASEIEKLVASPGQNFGRTIQHEGRLRGITDHEFDTLEQISLVLERGYTRLDEVLSQLKDSDLTRTGRHPRLGEKTLEWFIEEFVTQHLTNHLAQLQACLASTR